MKGLMDPVHGYLIEKGILKKETYDHALEEAEKSAAEINSYLIDREFIRREDLLNAMAAVLKLRRVEMPADRIDPRIKAIFPLKLLTRLNVAPVSMSEQTVEVAISEPMHLMAIDDLRLSTDLDVQPVLAKPEEIEKVLIAFGADVGAVRKALAELQGISYGEGEDDPQAAERLANEAPVVKLVNGLLEQAVETRASDIHIEPEEEVLNVKYRVDGVLQTGHRLDKNLRALVSSRIKIMSGLDIAEKRLPQDGHIRQKIQGRVVDFRVSTLPVIGGESVVLRVLDRRSGEVPLEKLGFLADMKSAFEGALESPNGIILVTGPTGSGKTTTLYAALRRLADGTMKILTIEDPVEFPLKGVMQMEVKHKIGLDFAAGLRSAMRQDPDVILVGEIRDRETAEVAVQASLTGHLVLATLHTNDAPSAVTRLVDMGIEPFLISASLTAVLAQRLIRRVCPNCQERIQPPESLLKSFDIHSPNGATFMRGRGCRECGQTGYRGRVGMYEFLQVTDDLRPLILQRADHRQIASQARRHGFRSLRHDGVEKARLGLTTLEEVARGSGE